MKSRRAMFFAVTGYPALGKLLYGIESSFIHSVRETNVQPMIHYIAPLLSMISILN